MTSTEANKDEPYLLKILTDGSRLSFPILICDV